MKPRRTHLSNTVFVLDGGNEDNDMWVTTYGPDEGGPVIGSTWVPTDEERARIAAGENIELLVWGDGQPPIAMRTNDYPLGRPPGMEV